MEIRIYFEGNRNLREPFKEFFSELTAAAQAARSNLEFFAAKDGVSAYRKATRSHPQAWNILLKDSEQPMSQNRETMCERHGIAKEHASRVFWMVELMEAWFLTHPEALAAYYGDGFSASAIGNTSNVEIIPKSDVEDRLKRATRNTTKGEYNKVSHAPYLLERLDSNRVQAHAPHCREMFEAVEARLGNP